MILTTPSGHKVEFKDRLTYGDKRAIKAVMLGEMKIDLSKVDKNNPEKSSSEIPLTFTLKMEEEVFRRAIKSITLSDGTQATGDLLDVVFNWNDTDGEAVFEYLKTGFNPEGDIDNQTQKKTEN